MQVEKTDPTDLEKHQAFVILIRVDFFNLFFLNISFFKIFEIHQKNILKLLNALFHLKMIGSSK